MADVTLTGPVADTLAAVAAVDDTDPHQLAQMVIADWLATHHHRFRQAADALAALFPDPSEADVEWQPYAGDLAIDPQVAQVVAEHHLEHRNRTDLQQLVDTSPASIDDLAPEETCNRCGRTFASKQGLGGHRRWCGKTTSAPAPKPEQPAVHPCPTPGCDETFTNPGGLASHRRWCNDQPLPAPPPKTTVGGCTRCQRPSARLTRGLCSRCTAAT